MLYFDDNFASAIFYMADVLCYTTITEGISEKIW